MAVLTEALRTSYESATKVLPSKQTITKSTVYEKIHGIAEEIPLVEGKNLKQCENLYIEADEDPVAEQHGRWYKCDNEGFISKLVYLYEYKQEPIE